MSETSARVGFMAEAVRLAREGMRRGDGGPFGCVVVRDGRIVGSGWNEVLATNDPTAHAEVLAIRRACAALQTFRLEDCEIYASCEPCPMCLAAIYWARVGKIFYANTHEDAAAIGFDDAKFYRELSLPAGEREIVTGQLMRAEAQAVFDEWRTKADRNLY